MQSETVQAVQESLLHLHLQICNRTMRPSTCPAAFGGMHVPVAHHRIHPVNPRGGSQPSPGKVVGLPRCMQWIPRSRESARRLSVLCWSVLQTSVLRPAASSPLVASVLGLSSDSIQIEDAIPVRTGCDTQCRSKDSVTQLCNPVRHPIFMTPGALLPSDNASQAGLAPIF